ncbi:MAG: DUF1080 domain-containing protein [Cyclobacteriaceae bacterium]
MRLLQLPFLILVLSLAITSCSSDKKSTSESQETSQREILFNGENLDGWKIYIENDSITPEEFFYVNDGMIETVGKPMGHLRTIKEYSNYRLHVEWRYPEEPTNSGVYLHTSGEDAAIPNHFQGQLKYENAGDFIVSGVGLTATIQDSTCTSTPEVRPLISKLHPSNEKPAGSEWNSYDITCKGDTIELRVNGLLQNVAINCSVTKGSIGLQAEGSKIQFRNLWVEPI